MLKNYVSKLKEKNNSSLLELSKQLDITYSTLFKMQTNSSNTISLANLEKFSKFENKNKIFILHEILFKDKIYKEKISYWTQLFLCKLYLENYNIEDIYFPKTNINLLDNIYFEGYAYKKRVAPNFIVVDSWTNIIDEYSFLHKKKISPKDFFASEEKYYYSLFQFALGKFYNCCEENIRRYYLLIEDKKTFEIISKFNVKGNSIHVIPLLVTCAEDIINIDSIV